MTSRNVEVIDKEGVLLVRANGKEVARIPDGVAIDAAGATAPVDVSLDGDDLVVRVEPEWLAADERVYPVVVDPELVVIRETGVQDTYLDSGSPTVNYSAAGGLRSGFASGREYVTLMRFVLPSFLSRHRILNGKWTAHVQDVNRANAQYALHPAGDSWDQRTATWANRPRHTGATALGAGNTNRRSETDITTYVKAWAGGSLPNNGLVIDSGGDGSSHITFKSAENYPSNLEPTLEITYVNEIAPPPDRNRAIPADGSHIPTTTPTLSIPATTDPEGAPIQYWFRVGQDTNAEDVEVLNSGWLDAPTWPVPAGTLRDGETYYWKVFYRDDTNPQGTVNSSSPPTSMKVDLRLGDQGPSAYDAAGPVDVNMSNGNAYMDLASPTFETVGGPVGLTYTYNSQAQSQAGLRAQYFNDCDGDTPPAALETEDPTQVRQEPNPSQVWAGSPAPLISADYWCARWTGFVSVPFDSTWCFNARRDDGVWIKVGDKVVVNSWEDQATFTTPWDQFTDCQDVLADKTLPIDIRYYDAVGGAQLSIRQRRGVSNEDIEVPAEWYSTAPRSLPQGWEVSAGLSGGSSYTGLRPNAAGVTLIDSSGDSSEFRSDGRGGFTPPAGEQAVVATGTEGGRTVYVVHAEDDMTYTFNDRGSLLRAESAIDDRRPAAVQYEYRGDSGRLGAIRDPVSGRTIVLTYSSRNLGGGQSSGCPAAGGFADVPNGLLCRVQYWDGTETRLFYNDAGQLARITDPGDEVTDIGYSGNLVTSVRDSLAYDAVTAGVRADDPSVRTDITYDGTRVASVTLPAPTAGAARPQRSYGYGAGQTDLHVAGLPEPNGYARRITYNGLGQVVSDRAADGLAATKEWDVADRLLSSTDTAGRRTTTIYDHADRPVDTYGPVPAGCFGSDRRPIAYCAAVTPHTRTGHDEGIRGLAATYWANPNRAGAASTHATGVGTSDGSLAVDWGSGSPAGLPADGFSSRFTGDITFPAGGSYALRLCSDDKGSLYIDDARLIDLPNNGCASASFDPGGTLVRRIRVDHTENTGLAGVGLYWSPPGQGEQLVPGTALAPRYGLVTSTVTDDATPGSPPQRSSSTYAAPERGLATTQTSDPGGLGLTTSTGFEPASGGYFRRTSRTLPAGNGWTYEYHPAADPVAAPCGAGSVVQGGLQRFARGPDPDGSGSQTGRVDETFYDTRGRVAASRVGDGAWTCTTRDARGRTLTTTVPAFGGAPERVATSEYAVAGNPLRMRVADPTGAVTTEVDLLGRITAYADVWGKTTTTTYDQAGRVTDTTGPEGVRRTEYAPDGRVSRQLLDGLVVAVPSYVPATGELAGASYPTGTGNGANGTSLAMGRDTAGRTNALTWSAPGGGLLASDAVTYSQAGQVVDETINGSTAGRSTFGYDAGGRLTRSLVAGRTTDYSFAASGGCGTLPTAGRNTNRTTMVVGAATTSYCYDAADRLTATSDGRFGGIQYDARGNTTRMGAQVMSYDGADRHRGTTAGAKTVTYQRDTTDRIVQRSETGPVPIVYRGVGSATNGSGASSLQLPRKTGISVGDRLVAHVSVAGGSSATVAPPTGWTLVSNVASGTSVRSVVYTRRVVSGESASYVFTLDSTRKAAGSIMAFGGIDTTTPIVSLKTETAAAGAAVAIPSGVTPVRGGSYQVGLLASSPASSYATPSNFSETVDTGGAGATVRPLPTTATTGRWPVPRTPTSSVAVGISFALNPAVGTSTVRYSYSGPGDGAAVTLDANGTVLERSIGLIGGATLTKRIFSSDIWSYPNIQGSIVATAGGTGAQTGTFAYDPYGVPLTATPVDNQVGNADFGWLGLHRRLTERGTGLAVVEMGARPYVAELGRFLEVDPVEGGSANDYDYVMGRPTVAMDLDGRRYDPGPGPGASRRPSDYYAIVCGGSRKGYSKSEKNAVKRMCNGPWPGSSQTWDSWLKFRFSAYGRVCARKPRKCSAWEAAWNGFPTTFGGRLNR